MSSGAAGPRLGVQDREAADVASLPGGLQRQELRVKAGELPHSVSLPADHRTARPSHGANVPRPGL